MSTLTIQLPDSIARELEQCAAREGVTVDQLMSAAAAEKVSALLTIEHLRQRAAAANREDFLHFLDESPGVAPVVGDGVE
ncbi:MAG: hypothetical protein DVB23_001016 [Verrucomicrobia bacterium]|jgi:hypothetical protein|nr:MAG: hypothetical protein DVB23_001016 [Verrucomicrobiota bacterium]